MRTPGRGFAVLAKILRWFVGCCGVEVALLAFEKEFIDRSALFTIAWSSGSGGAVTKDAF